jgi:REP element-mobilizing transposase RayT
MPDHIHGIIFIKESIPAADYPESVPAALVAAGPVGLGTSPNPTDFPPTLFDQIRRPSLFDIVGAFKSISTVLYIRGVHNLGWDPFPKRLWQRMYYEHIIRNESELKRVRRYIMDNPIKF